MTDTDTEFLRVLADATACGHQLVTERTIAHLTDRKILPVATKAGVRLLATAHRQAQAARGTRLLTRALRNIRHKKGVSLATLNFPHDPECSGCPACREIAAALLTDPTNPALLRAMHGEDRHRQLAARPHTIRTHIHLAEDTMKDLYPRRRRLTVAEVATYATPNPYEADAKKIRDANDREELRTLGSTSAHLRQIVVPDDPSAMPVNPYERDAELLRKSNR